MYSIVRNYYIVDTLDVGLYNIYNYIYNYHGINIYYIDRGRPLVGTSGCEAAARLPRVAQFFFSLPCSQSMRQEAVS